MCGIFGVILKPNSKIASVDFTKLLSNLYQYSESRGMESAGLNLYLPEHGQAWTLKGMQSATKLLKSADFKHVIKECINVAFNNNKTILNQPMVALAHSRLVTNGAAGLSQNNQPVRSGHITMIHNGIVVNVEELWDKHKHLERQAQVDTEFMAALADASMTKSFDPVETTQHIYQQIKGAASIAWVHEHSENVTLATNTGDLYYRYLPGKIGLVFASERFILEKATQEMFKLQDSSQLMNEIKWLANGTGLTISLSNFKVIQFELNSIQKESVDHQRLDQRAIVHHECTAKVKSSPIIINRTADESLLNYNEQRMRELKRCSRCVLPTTFPFIKFDEQGVCNYCHKYKPHYAKMHSVDTKKKFIESLQKYARSGKGPDVLVPFSGGRDSSYGLHLIHHEFDLKPITFTYDWGMVTDLARRNVARMCGKLGVQNILVSANLKTKRDNIRKNVSAWLKKPDLGMIPLFMAGDKHFFKVVNQLKRQTGIDLDLWCANPLENTDFKSGFCGISPDFDKERLDYLSIGRKAKLAAYYGTRFMTNPGYINSSLRDTFGAFLAYYFEPRKNFYFMFDHFIWNEDEVNRTLLSEYDWEIAPDSTSTWRIGDGTAPFYNYIYNTSHGFSEFDTFRSNQIREGMITREKALESICIENRPRAESLRWYLDTLGLDFNTVIKRINEMDVMGVHQ